MASQFSIADAWFGRDAFYERRVGCRSRENERFYQRLVRRYYSFLVPAGASALEMGCGLGDLLAEIKPSRGVGVDFSAKTVGLARQRHPELEFHVGDAASWCQVEGTFNREIREIPKTVENRFLGASKKPVENDKRDAGRGMLVAGRPSLSQEFDGLAGGTPALPGFDYILLADLINDLPDVQRVFEHLQTMAHARTRLVLNFFNNLWRPALAVAEWMGAKAPSLLQNWLSTADVKNLLHLAGWEVVQEEHRILWPLHTPLFSTLLNRWVAPFLPDFGLTIFIVARPVRSSGFSRFERTSLSRSSPLDESQPDREPNRLKPGLRTEQPPHSSFSIPHPSPYRCSVVVPARNEAGNIEAAVLRTPEMGLGTELIFVEGHSSDDTWEEIQRVAQKYSQRNIKVLKQRTEGKGGAVREGFAVATGDLLFILDADLTMPPEELPKFYEIARSGTAEFINGVRLVYPMEHEAMRFLNMVANKIFGLTFSWLLGQPLKDTLCGTKVLFRADYERLARNRGYFGDFDPFGDFDLLFGASKLNLRIIDLPIRYRARTYGETNIRRWQHGWLLLRMVFFAARRLKFL